MNNCELSSLYIYTVRFLLISLRNLLYNSSKFTNTYKQTSTVIYNRLSVITKRKQKRFKLVFRVLFTAIVNSPCFHTPIAWLALQIVDWSLELATNLCCYFVTFVYIYKFRRKPECAETIHYQNQRKAKQTACRPSDTSNKRFDKLARRFSFLNRGVSSRKASMEFLFLN